MRFAEEVSLLHPRIGSVPYLNARPLVHDLDPAPALLPPAPLADALHQDRLDVALVPIFECLVHDQYDLVDGVAIAARHPVHSVIFVADQPHHEWKTLALDPDSRTSAALSRVITEIFWHQEIQYVPPGNPSDARLIIGDPARDYRRLHPQHPVIDLAEEWTKHTSLPFVFAVWAVRRASSSRGLANYLRETAARGLSLRPQLAANEEELLYLTHHISYDLELPEKKAISLFAHYLVTLGLIPSIPALVWI